MALWRAAAERGHAGAQAALWSANTGERIPEPSIALTPGEVGGETSDALMAEAADDLIRDAIGADI